MAFHAYFPGDTNASLTSTSTMQCHCAAAWRSKPQMRVWPSSSDRAVPVMQLGRDVWPSRVAQNARACGRGAPRQRSDWRQPRAQARESCERPSDSELHIASVAATVSLQRPPSDMAADKPINFAEHVQLQELGIAPESISFANVTLESEK